MRDLVQSISSTFQDGLENVVYLDNVDSTHSFCLRLMDQMDELGFDLGPTVVIAGRQVSGRGRGDRRWESPAGGLYLNWVRSGLAPETIGLLPMLAAAAAHRAISESGVTEAGIKWPNDIVVDGKKLAGLLIHVRGGEAGWATVGLGVNLQTTPTSSPTAMIAAIAMAELVDPAPLERWCIEVTSEFVASLTRFLDDTGPALDLWRSRLVHRAGERLSVRLGCGRTETGTFEGLTAEGFLRLRQNGAERIITSGDVLESS